MIVEYILKSGARRSLKDVHVEGTVITGRYRDGSFHTIDRREVVVQRMLRDQFGWTRFARRPNRKRRTRKVATA